MRKKIALLTIHRANSYGGVLQAYATQHVLSRYGDVEVLDYQTRHLANTMRLFRIFDGPRGLLRAGKDLFRLRSRHRLLKKFRNFVSTNLKMSRRLSSLRQLESYAQHFDVVVCGSDQIWNPNVTGKLDPAYFLSFGGRAERISLASSMGSFRFPKRDVATVVSSLQKFKAISVREPDTASYLTENGLPGVRVVADPTLLLNRDEWMALAGSSKRPAAEEYIAVYALKNSGVLSSAIQHCRDLLGLNVIAIDQNPFRSYPCDVHIQDAGPIDFVRIIAGAKFVLTNSFHGTAFSINFGVPFLVVPPETGANRITGLLADFGISDRLISQEEDLHCLSKDDLLAKAAVGRLASYRSYAHEYLQAAIEMPLRDAQPHAW